MKPTPHMPLSFQRLLFFFFLVCSFSVSGELVSISEFGYHPLQTKQVVSYGDSASGTFTIIDSNDAIVYSGPLQKARAHDNSIVQCQGNNPCLVGDFTSFATPGTYAIRTSIGGESKSFVINENRFETFTPTMLEFFDALRQYDSSYHADLHSDIDPAFNIMADGSFIMEADQATLTLIRLGSAYRRNPALFEGTDIQEHIQEYVDYIIGLQGVQIQQRTDGVGFRLNPHVEAVNAFVPGPTELSSITVYIADSSHTPVKNVPVISLCGADDGTSAWDECISDAAFYFKCQVDEPCLNSTYMERTGVLLGHDGYAVSRGWGYEFGCFADIDLENSGLTDKDPCQIFYPETSAKYTVQALLGFLEAVPAIHDEDEDIGNELLQRAVQTYQYVKSHFLPLSGDDAAMWGTSLFLLYNYTGQQEYLIEAYNMRDEIATNFIGDKTHGNEFYWEEYARAKQAIISAGLSYNYQNEDPVEFFRGKMYFDYKDAGQNKAMSYNAERVFQFDPNIQFQNSRFMLTEAVLASKATELHPSPESFIPLIADHQLAWLTGMNGVQYGTSLGSPIISQSFIFGIGDNPSQFHSRLLINTGFTSASNGAIIGARGTSYQFFNGTDYINFDGAATILGKTFGALGNTYRDEEKTTTYNVGQTFMNGLDYIPGWINGAFDSIADNDVIFNYRDNLDTYEFTETTNEIVATALELFAYMDARYNNRPRHPGILGNVESTPPVNSNTTPVNTTPPVNNTPTQNTTSVNTTHPQNNTPPMNDTPVVNTTVIVNNTEENTPQANTTVQQNTTQQNTIPSNTAQQNMTTNATNTTSTHTNSNSSNIVNNSTSTNTTQNTTSQTNNSSNQNTNQNTNSNQNNDEDNEPEENNPPAPNSPSGGGGGGGGSIVPPPQVIVNEPIVTPTPTFQGESEQTSVIDRIIDVQEQQAPQQENVEPEAQTSTPSPITGNTIAMKSADEESRWKWALGVFLGISFIVGIAMKSSQRDEVLSKQAAITKKIPKRRRKKLQKEKVHPFQSMDLP